MSNRATHAIFILINAALFIWVTVSGPSFQPDSASYMQNDMTRGPIYPLLIDVFELVLGASGSLWATTCFQLAVCMAGLSFFAFIARKHFSLTLATTYTLLALLFLPLGKFGTNILSEPLAYGLYAFFVGFMLRHTFTRTPKDLWFMVAMVTLELLIRPQLIYIIPFLVLYGLLMLGVEKKRIYAFFLMAIFLAWTGSGLIRNTYNYIYHGTFDQQSTIGKHLLANQLYVVSGDTINDVKDSAHKAFLKEAYAKIRQSNMSIRDWDKTRDHYDRALPVIYYEILPGIPTNHPGLNGVVGGIETDNYYKELGFELMTLDPLATGRLFFAKIYHGPIFFLGLTLALFFLAIAWFVRTHSPHALVYMSISTLTFLNYGILLPFTHLTKRYTIFSDSYQIAFTVLCGLYLLHLCPKADSK